MPKTFEFDLIELNWFEPNRTKLNRAEFEVNWSMVSCTSGCELEGEYCVLNTFGIQLLYRKRWTINLAVFVSNFIQWHSEMYVLRYLLHFFRAFLWSVLLQRLLQVILDVWVLLRRLYISVQVCVYHYSRVPIRAMLVAETAAGSCAF